MQLTDLAETGVGLTPGGRYQVKIRSAAKPSPARSLRGRRTAPSSFSTSLPAHPAPGQSAVLYRGDLLVGGGVISEILPQVPAGQRP